MIASMVNARMPYRWQNIDDYSERIGRIRYEAKKPERECECNFDCACWRVALNYDYDVDNVEVDNSNADNVDADNVDNDNDNRVNDYLRVKLKNRYAIDVTCVCAVNAKCDCLCLCACIDYILLYRGRNQFVRDIF